MPQGLCDTHALTNAGWAPVWVRQESQSPVPKPGSIYTLTEQHWILTIHHLLPRQYLGWLHTSVQNQTILLLYKAGEGSDWCKRKQVVLPEASSRLGLLFQRSRHWCWPTLSSLILHAHPEQRAWQEDTWAAWCHNISLSWRNNFYEKAIDCQIIWDSSNCFSLW